MKFFRKINSATVLGLVLLLGGLHVAYSGVTRGVILTGWQKYFVGGFMVVIGAYFIFLGLKQLKNGG